MSYSYNRLDSSTCPTMFMASTVPDSYSVQEFPNSEAQINNFTFNERETLFSSILKNIPVSEAPIPDCVIRQQLEFSKRMKLFSILINFNETYDHISKVHKVLGANEYKRILEYIFNGDEGTNKIVHRLNDICQFPYAITIEQSAICIGGNDFNSAAYTIYLNFNSHNINGSSDLSNKRINFRTAKTLWFKYEKIELV